MQLSACLEWINTRVLVKVSWPAFSRFLVLFQKLCLILRCAIARSMHVNSCFIHRSNNGDSLTHRLSLIQQRHTEQYRRA